MVLLTSHSNGLEATCIPDNNMYFFNVFFSPKRWRLGSLGDPSSGPFYFWYIYMNNIKEACKKFIPILYADDTGLVSSLCSFYDDKDKYDINEISRDINDELSCVQEWLNINKLSLNVSKTKYMIFHHRQRNIDEFIPVFFLGICSHNEYRTLNMHFSANECCTSFANFVPYFYM